MIDAQYRLLARYNAWMNSRLYALCASLSVVAAGLFIASQRLAGLEPVAEATAVGA